jgi:uncharacterized phage protein gp47/JayE
MTTGYRGLPRPTLSEIENRVLSDINFALPGSDASLEFTPLNALAMSLIGCAQELYGYLDYAAKQTNVLDCSDENLDRYATIWGLERLPADYSQGTISFVSTGTPVIPIGTAFQTNNQLQFVSTADNVMGTGVTTVAVSSVLPGKTFNLADGASMTPSVSIAGISTGSSAAINGGADTETDSALRARLLTRISTPPNGGSANDYCVWALESSADVTRAWAYPQELGDGTVVVRFMTDNATSDGIPAPADELAMYNYIDPLRPVTAKLYCISPIAVALNVQISNLTPDTAATRAAAAAEIANLIKTRSEPGGVIYLSWIWNAVSLATGNVHHIISSPSADAIASTGHIFVPGTVTYI